MPPEGGDLAVTTADELGYRCVGSRPEGAATVLTLAWTRGGYAPHSATQRCDLMAALQAGGVPVSAVTSPVVGASHPSEFRMVARNHDDATELDVWLASHGRHGLSRAGCDGGSHSPEG